MSPTTTLRKRVFNFKNIISYTRCSDQPGVSVRNIEINAPNSATFLYIYVYSFVRALPNYSSDDVAHLVAYKEITVKVDSANQTFHVRRLTRRDTLNRLRDARIFFWYLRRNGNGWLRYRECVVRINNVAGT